MKIYSLGFMFCDDLSSVILIRKSKPPWQVGKLNGVGGKVEELEEPLDSMVREFKEEAGVQTDHSDWTHFATLTGTHFLVKCFTGRNSTHHDSATSQTEEEIIRMALRHTPDYSMISNVYWLLTMAIDRLCDGRFHAEIRYDQ